MKKKILIVDDEVTFTRLVKLNLEETGIYEVKTVNKAIDAYAAVVDFQPDLILLDIIMPDMEGNEIAWQIRSSSDAKIKNTPIVYLTAMMTKEEENKYATNISGEPFIAKPVQLDDLLECIERNIK